MSEYHQSDIISERQHLGGGRRQRDLETSSKKGQGQKR